MLKGDRKRGEGRKTKREMRESQDDWVLAILLPAVFYTTHRILDPHGAVRSKVTSLGALAAFLCINACINFYPLKDSPTRPRKFPISSVISPSTRICFHGTRHLDMRVR